MKMLGNGLNLDISRPYPLCPTREALRHPKYDSNKSDKPIERDYY